MTVVNTDIQSNIALYYFTLSTPVPWTKCCYIVHTSPVVPPSIVHIRLFVNV